MPKMTFIKTDGTRVEVEAPLGLSVLEIAHRNNIDLEGACEGSLACSTCHVIIDPEWYDLLESASDDEEDMLDLAFGLTHTSRLGCQIKITPELDGLEDLLVRLGRIVGKARQGLHPLPQIGEAQIDHIRLGVSLFELGRDVVDIGPAHAYFSSIMLRVAVGSDTVNPSSSGVILI